MRGCISLPGATGSVSSLRPSRPNHTSWRSAAVADAQTIVPLVETLAKLPRWLSSTRTSGAIVLTSPVSRRPSMSSACASSSPSRTQSTCPYPPSFDGAYRPLASDVTRRTGAASPSTESR